MIRLSRETRFALLPEAATVVEKPANNWAGWPATNRIVPHLRVQLIAAGIPDPVTGYLCNISIIDRLLAEVIQQDLAAANYDWTAERLLHGLCDGVVRQWRPAMTAPDAHAADPPPRFQRLTLILTPQLKYSLFPSSLDDAMSQGQPSPPAAGSRPVTRRVELTEQFEFSAAHRLNCEQLGEEENRRLFSKCNNPAGHGHNYVVEVSLTADVEPVSGQVISLPDFESTVKRNVIDRLDHQHLNQDVEYFRSVNPSVENIAMAIYQWLEGEFGSARLSRVRVYETPKTWAEYAGD